MMFAARKAFLTTKNAAHASTFRVLGIQQLALGHTDKSAMSHLWTELLGLSVTGKTYKSEKENVDEDILYMPTERGSEIPAVELDLMQPLDINKRPAVHSPALNHFGLWIDDLPAAVKELSEKGMRFTPGGIRKGASGYDVVFIHPKGNAEFPFSGLGCLIELVQAPEHVVKAFKK